MLNLDRITFDPEIMAGQYKTKKIDVTLEDG